MCGILGIVGPNAPREVVREVFTNLLVNTQVRGTDATGIAATRLDGSPIMRYREAIEAKKFVATDQYKEFMDQYDGGVLIGHCRRTTKGSEKNNENNHPLISERTGIAVIHNGTVADDIWRVTNDDGENPYMLDKFTAQVDTEAIMRLIDTMLYIPRDKNDVVVPEKVAATPKDQWKRSVSLNTAIQDAVFNLSGGMSCAVLDPTEPLSLRLWRSGNPCVVAYVPDYEMFVFASTEDILKKSLVTYRYEDILDYFSYGENDFPDYFHRETTEKTLLHIQHTDDKAKPFLIKDYEIVPSGAVTVRASIEGKSGVKANATSVKH